MANAHNYRAINYAYLLSSRPHFGPAGEKQLYLTLYVAKKSCRNKVNLMNERRALKLMFFVDRSSVWRVACGVRHAKPNFLFTFEEEQQAREELNLKAREKPKKKKNKSTHKQTNKGGSRRTSRPYQ